MKKICFFQFDTSNTELFLPMMWFSLKRYYEINSKYADFWEWIPPRVDFKNWQISDIVDNLTRHKADVYAFSSYMWSWNIIRVVAKKIKEKLPNAILILGGPHQTSTYSSPIFWFKKNYFFDATCLPTEYGEFFVLDALDLIIEDKLDWSKVRNSYHRGGYGPLGNKKEFIFPKELLSKNLDIGLEYSQTALKVNRKLTLPYETTRGCPYGCVYCEWGGGTNSKVIAKPIEDIKEDLFYFQVLGIETLYLCDANFGILPRDKEVANLFAEMSTKSLKNIYISGLAKTSSEKRKAVLEPLLKAGVINGYAMAVQATNPEIGKIIDRVDISIEENLKLAEYLTDKYPNCSIRIELIMGLPGFTKKDFYEECSIFWGKYTKATFTWFVLPDSPGANPDYLKKWNIKIVPIGLESEQKDFDGYLSIHDESIIEESLLYIPVSTFSYSVEDWKEMTFMYDFETVLYNRHVLKLFVEFMKVHRNQEAGITLKKIFEAVSKVPEFYTPIDNYLQEIADGKFSKKDWKIIPDLNMNVFKGYFYLWTKNLDKIFKSLHKTFSVDEQIEDCLEYIKNTTIREDKSVNWKSKWDWCAWEQFGHLEKKSTTIVTKASMINWTPTINRTEHSLVDNKKIILENFDSQVTFLKNEL
jgi:putative methyltransferase